MRVPVELVKSYRLLNHGPVTLISAASGGRENVMAAAWVMPLDFDPPRLAAVIAHGTYTRELVDASGEAVVCIPVRAQVELVKRVGSISGRAFDKLSEYGIATSPASVVKAPLIDGCAAWLECRVVREPHSEEAYDLFILEVAAAWANDAVYRDGRWSFPDDSWRTLHHVAGGGFFVTGDPVAG